MAEHSFEQNLIRIPHSQINKDGKTLLLLILGKGSIDNRDDSRVEQVLQALTFG